ncbi:methionine/alanine import family NSS transporter small subunit [Microcella daejeonensis]|jgi:Putative methionine and alanine importer, small subunit|uniref:Methionine/alanine import family NSS transporter small subunit n=1 Tax=Microcella daejeonensis TaxID=2994971 RepID=A0A9E8MLM9_9MICO|nr:methionine/alanine import family NSS transporter small subunit [Microcella daejeonensis]WAB81895.1 methionine/alanine import family NSS transporter small subunit [Microcella daejeonensis]
MTPIAITFLIGALVIIWGGLAASILVLRRRPERDDYPAGGEPDEREGTGPVERDS